MAVPDLRHVQAGDLNIGYREAGSGPALFFVHGMGGGSGNWETQYDRFADRYRVIGWDAPGYGESTAFESDPPSVGDYVMAMADFLDALGIEKVHLVGHSYGGIMVAGFQRAFRDRVLSLTLAQPVIGGGVADVKTRDEGIRERAEELERLGMDGFAKKHVPFSCSPDAAPEVIARGIAITAAMNPAGYLRQFRSLRHANIFEWTMRPRVPAMIVSGADDRTASRKMVEDIAVAMPGIRHRVIEGIGHMIYLEHPERFNVLLEDLLARAG